MFQKKLFPKQIIQLSKLIVVLGICSFSSCNDTLPPKPPIILADFNAGLAVGEINNTEIDEASGLVASKNMPGKLWVHNDSGDKNRIFLLNTSGQWQGTFYLNGVGNRDWEDIAISKINNENYLFLADIGDNEASYNNEYFIYKVKEPSAVSNGDTYLNNVETIKFKYNDGARDAETLLVDQLTQDMYVITKREERIRVYKIAAPQATNTINTAEFVSELSIGGQLGGVPAGATGGDISVDNSEIIIKSYFQIFYWKLKTDETIKQALSRSYDKTLPYSPEPQGEGIGFAADNTGYYTIGEAGEAKNIVNLYFYKRK